MNRNAYGQFSMLPYALLDSGVSAGAIHLYAVIWRYADAADREAWPSRQTLADALGKSVDTVDRLMRELVAVGAIEVVRRTSAMGDNLSNVYRVLVMEPADDDGRTDAATGPHECGDGAADVRPPGRTDAAQTRTTHPEPLIQNHSESTPDPLGVVALIEPPVADVDPFDRFWAAYPRREGKAAARKAWAKVIRRFDPERIIAAAEAYGSSPYLPDVEFRPHASSWLNGERWDDPPLAPRATQGAPSPTDRAVDVLAMAASLQAQQDGARRGIGA